MYVVFERHMLNAYLGTVMMNSTERTPLLHTGADTNKPRQTYFSAAHRVLFAGFLISIALSFTQVPILYAFRFMECDEFYKHETLPSGGNRCIRAEIDAATAAQVSILGISSTFAGVLNLFYAGWQIRRLGPRFALILQCAFPALRAVIQVLGVAAGARQGVIIVQCSQVVSLIGGVAGYLLVLNTAIGELVPAAQRTAMFGMLQGSVMVGTATGYLLGGLVGEMWGMRRPFEIAASLFVLSSLYAAVFIPYIDPRSLSKSTPSGNGSFWHRMLSGLKVLAPREFISVTGKRRKEFGVTFLALGVFLGVLATGYAPILIQMYSTAALDFASKENGYLMAGNSLMRGVYLIFLFPRIIHTGRSWHAASTAPPSALIETVSDGNTIAASQEDDALLHNPDTNGEERAFDLLFLRWSLVMDGLITASTAFASRKWHIYLAGALLPLASGSAPASKGVVTEMCTADERANALQAMTLVENLAMVSTLGLFGFIFSVFSVAGKAWMTFYCNAAVAMLAVLVLGFSRFPKERASMDDLKSPDCNSSEVSASDE